MLVPLISIDVVMFLVHCYAIKMRLSRLIFYEENIKEKRQSHEKKDCCYCVYMYVLKVNVYLALSSCCIDA